MIEAKLKEDIIILDDWDISIVNFNPCDHPENRDISIAGRCYGHPEYKDGKYIRPSGIVAFDPDEKVFLTSSGSRYKIGKVNAEYEKKFSGAENRVVNHFSSKLPTILDYEFENGPMGLPDFDDKF